MAYFRTEARLNSLHDTWAQVDVEMRPALRAPVSQADSTAWVRHYWQRPPSRRGGAQGTRSYGGERAATRQATQSSAYPRSVS